MQKIKNFFRTFWKSLTDIAYYKDILKAKFSFSLKYLVVLVFLSALVLGIKALSKASQILPKVPGYVAESKKVLQEVKLEAKVKEPYFIDYPDKSVAEKLPFKHLLAVDSQAKLEDFKKYEAFFLLTEKSIVAINGQSGGLKEIALEGSFSQTLDKALPYLDSLPRLIQTSLIFGLSFSLLLNFAFSLTWQLLILLPVALILFFLAKLVKSKLSYKNIYQLSMHGSTLLILLSTLGTLVGFNLSFLPLIVFLVWMGLIISRCRF